MNVLSLIGSCLVATLSGFQSKQLIQPRNAVIPSTDAGFSNVNGVERFWIGGQYSTTFYQRYHNGEFADYTYEFDSYTYDLTYYNITSNNQLSSTVVSHYDDGDYTDTNYTKDVAYEECLKKIANLSYRVAILEVYKVSHQKVTDYYRYYSFGAVYNMNDGYLYVDDNLNYRSYKHMPDIPDYVEFYSYMNGNQINAFGHEHNDNDINNTILHKPSMSYGGNSLKGYSWYDEDTMVNNYIVPVYCYGLFAYDGQVGYFGEHGITQFTYNRNTLDNDYATGYWDGYSQGMNDGLNSGTSYGEGYQDGKNQGYYEGYNAGLEYNGYSFTNLFASIADTPVLMIRSLFDFDLFGMNVLVVVLSLFTSLIVFYLLRKLL